MNAKQVDNCVIVPLMVVLPSSFLALACSLYHDLHRLSFVDAPFGPFMVPYGAPAILTLLCSLAVWFAIPFGRIAVLPLAVGYSFAFFVLFNFRGPLHWHGLFDLTDRSPWPAYAWIPASIIVGLVGYWIAPMALVHSRVKWLFIVASGSALLYAWIQAIARTEVYSYYPLTMHLAVTTIVGFASLAAVFISKYNPDLWEDI